jgi:hypothetical protein
MMPDPAELPIARVMCDRPSDEGLGDWAETLRVWAKSREDGRREIRDAIDRRPDLVGADG